MEVDASPKGLGAVLTQVMDNGDQRPIAFASRSLSPAEINYSQLEREGLAIIFGIEKFHQYLYGRKFTLVTDNKPLSLILGPKKGIPALATARLQRWAIKLSAYNYDIEYKSSKYHQNADALSRLPLPEGPGEECSGLFSLKEVTELHKVQLENLPVSARQIRAATLNDPVMSRVMHYVVNGWPQVSELAPEMKPYGRCQDELTIEEGCLLRGIRVLIPAKLQTQVLTELHATHPGIVRMKALARMHVWWPELDMNIEATVRNCSDCQAVQSTPAANLNPWIWPLKPWQRIHIDYAGPFEGSMFLVVVDAHSKWIEVVKMSGTSAESTVNALRFLFATHGLAEEVVSDNGPQFVAAEFKEFMHSNGIKHYLSAPYHPRSNGEAERAVRTFKTAMKTMKKGNASLNQRLACFLLSYRTTPHTITGRTPAEMLMGRSVRTRLSAMKPDLGNRMNKRSSKVNTTPREFQVGDPVMVRDYRNQAEPWTRGVIHEVLGPVTYRVTVGCYTWKRHIDQILCSSVQKDNRMSEMSPNNVDIAPALCVPPSGCGPTVPAETDISKDIPIMDNSPQGQPKDRASELCGDKPTNHSPAPPSPQVLRRSKRVISQPKRFIEQ